MSKGTDEVMSGAAVTIAMVLIAVFFTEYDSNQEFKQRFDETYFSKLPKLNLSDVGGSSAFKMAPGQSIFGTSNESSEAPAETTTTTFRIVLPNTSSWGLLYPCDFLGNCPSQTETSSTTSLSTTSSATTTSEAQGDNMVSPVSLSTTTTTVTTTMTASSTTFQTQDRNPGS